MCGFWWRSIHSTFPIQDHLELSPDLLIDGTSRSSLPHFFLVYPHQPIILLTTSLNTCGGMCPASPHSSYLVTREERTQVLHSHSSTAVRLELKMLILEYLLSWPFSWILTSLLNATLAFPELLLMSSAAPLWLVILAPRWSNLSMSSLSCPPTTTALLFFALIVMSLVFLVLIFRPIPFLFLFRKSVFIWTCVNILDHEMSAKSSAKS